MVGWPLGHTLEAWTYGRSLPPLPARSTPPDSDSEKKELPLVRRDAGVAWPACCECASPP